jgi:hypothetical protein
MGGANGYGTVFTLTTGASGAVTPISQFASGSSGFQICLTGAVELINSGNKTSPPGSFSVYADTTYYFEETGTFDGQQVLLSSPSLPLNNNTAISIPSLKPGQSTIVTFYQQGSAVDNRLKLPPNYDPTGVDSIIGVVTYSDPIGDFDGSAKLVSPFQF